MSARTAAAFDEPPRGFAGLGERLAERQIAVRWDERCPLCGGADGLGVGACLSCLDRSGDRLIYLRHPVHAEQRRENVEIVRSLLPPEVHDVDVGLVADGHLALAAVPKESSGGLEVALFKRGLSVRFTSVRWSVASSPLSLKALLATVVFVGTLAGAVVFPALTITSPLFALGLWLLAQKHLQRPATADPTRSRWLEQDDEATLVRALIRLPKGRAKELLVELVRVGRLLHARAQMAGDEAVAEDTGALLTVAAQVAEDLAETESLNASATNRMQIMGEDDESRTAVLRLTDTSVRLENLLLDAIEVLGGANHRLLADRTEGSELSYLVHEIDRGRSAYRDAFREIEDMLAMSA